MYGREPEELDFSKESCPFTASPKKKPYSLFEKSKNLGTQDSTIRFYFFLRDTALKMLYVILVPSLILIYRYHQIFMKLNKDKEKTAWLYFRSFWDYTDKMYYVLSETGTNTFMESITYEYNWTTAAAICFLSLMYASLQDQYYQKVYNCDKERKRRADDFTAMITNLDSKTSIEKIKKGCFDLIERQGYPIEYFEIIKVNKAVNPDSVFTLSKEIENCKIMIADLKKEQRRVESQGVLTEEGRKTYQDQKEQYLTKIEKLEKKKEKISQKEARGELKERLTKSIAFVTFATTLQRDLFLTIISKDRETLVEIDQVSCKVLPAIPTQNIEWRSIGYDISQSVLRRLIVLVLKIGVLVLLLFGVLQFELLIKVTSWLKIIGPILILILSKLVNKLREKMALWSKVLLTDLLTSSGVAFFAKTKKLITIGGLYATYRITFERQHKLDPHQSPNAFQIYSSILYSYLAIKILLVPLSAIFKLRDVVSWIRRRLVISKYKKSPESIPKLQKDINRRFERLEAPLVPIFARITYLSFINLGYSKLAPLITVACIISILVQSQVDKYLMLRRYKKLPYIFTLGKRKITGELIKPVFYYVVLFRWMGWILFSSFGFRSTTIEYAREGVMMGFVVGAKFAHQIINPRYYFWYELKKFGKFKDFTQKFKLTALNMKSKLNDPALRYKDFYLTETLIKTLESENKRVEGKNLFGASMQELRDLLDGEIRNLREDDYCRNCELDLEEDYDRANPATGYAAWKAFLMKRQERAQLEDQGRVIDGTEVNLNNAVREDDGFEEE